MTTSHTAFDMKDIDLRIQEIYSQLKFDIQSMKDERKSKEQAAREVAIIKREIERLNQDCITLREILKKRGGRIDV